MNKYENRKCIASQPFLPSVNIIPSLVATPSLSVASRGAPAVSTCRDGPLCAIPFPKAVPAHLSFFWQMLEHFITFYQQVGECLMSEYPENPKTNLSKDLSLFHKVLNLNFSVSVFFRGTSRINRTLEKFYIACAVSVCGLCISVHDM